MPCLYKDRNKVYFNPTEKSNLGKKIPPALITKVQGET